MSDPTLCMIAPGDLFGGVETQILGLVQVLATRRGSTPTVVLFHDGELARQLRETGCEPVILTSRNAADPAPVGQLARVIAAGRGDVLHLHGYRASVTAALCGSARARPIVKTVHGLPEPGGGPAAQLKARLYRNLDDWATRTLRATVCYVTADILRRCEGAHRGLQRRVVHNGIVPLDRGATRRPPELNPAVFNAGIVGRVSAVKGIETALQGLAGGETPERVHLHVVGDGPLRGELEARTSVLGLADRVHFHGFRRDIYDWLAHLDVVLMPSLHEGLPYTLLEAMSLGTPVVTSQVGGLAEVLIDGETGLLCEVGDVAGFASALSRLAGDPSLGAGLGATAARVQRERYTLERMTDDYLEIYDSLSG